MSVTPQNNKRRDWSLIIFILPLGVVMMLCVGQLAIRMAPNWSVEGEMKSFLDPEKAAKQDALIVPPVSSDILTPVSWWDTFLTPMADSGSGVVFPPFIIFEPTSTPTATASPIATTSSPIATSSITSTPTPPTKTPTKKPTDDDETSTPPTATATTASPTATATTTTPTVTATTTTPTTCTDPLANNNGGSLPCIYPVTSTPEGILVAGTPVNFNQGAPNGSIGNVVNGNYVVITLTTSIVVNGPSDTNYDFVYYELYRPLTSDIALDSVILSISSDGAIYYEVFNWGDGVPDNNSNVGDVTTSTGTEDDNQSIPVSELHGTPPLQTGILVDVDNAPSAPPNGSYSYLAIQAPIAPVFPTTDGGLDVDSVEVIEVPP